MSAPVAYRIKDYGDGWILQESLTDSERAIYSEQGNVVQALIPADRITALEKENAELRKALETIRDYPPVGGRRTEDGYPLEVVYDEFAYRRIVDSYRAVGRSALRDGGET